MPETKFVHILGNDKDTQTEITLFGDKKGFFKREDGTYAVVVESYYEGTETMRWAEVWPREEILQSIEDQEADIETWLKLDEDAKIKLFYIGLKRERIQFLVSRLAVLDEFEEFIN